MVRTNVGRFLILCRFRYKLEVKLWRAPNPKISHFMETIITIGPNRWPFFLKLKLEPRVLYLVQQI
jgi:hypothetical protein